MATRYILPDGVPDKACALPPINWTIENWSFPQ